MTIQLANRLQLVFHQGYWNAIRGGVAPHLNNFKLTRVWKLNDQIFLSKKSAQAHRTHCTKLVVTLCRSYITLMSALTTNLDYCNSLLSYVAYWCRRVRLLHSPLHYHQSCHVTNLLPTTAEVRRHHFVKMRRERQIFWLTMKTVLL